MATKSLTEIHNKVLPDVWESLAKKKTYEPCTYRRIAKKHVVNIAAISLAEMYDATEKPTLYAIGGWGWRQRKTIKEESRSVREI